MWGEKLDQTVWEQTFYLRGSALAERLWSTNLSAATLSNQTLLAQRLIPHRCRLLQRGFQVEPFDARDSFDRRDPYQQCELWLPEN